MDFIEALRIVYDLAEGNQLADEEADTDELKEVQEEQEDALAIINDILEGQNSHGVVLPPTS